MGFKLRVLNVVGWRAFVVGQFWAGGRAQKRSMSNDHHDLKIHRQDENECCAYDAASREIEPSRRQCQKELSLPARMLCGQSIPVFHAGCGSYDVVFLLFFFPSGHRGCKSIKLNGKGFSRRLDGYDNASGCPPTEHMPNRYLFGSS